MTLHDTETSSLKDKDFILATDLDGTFLGGSEEERKDFYTWFEANRSRIGLIFVTGRDPGFITNLTKRGGVPKPEYAVADVGTTIAKVGEDHFLSPIAELEEDIAAAWMKNGNRVATMLQGNPGLKLQSNAFRYRASFDMDASRFDDKALQIVADEGLDALVSDGKFFDVLPKDVSKGPSLLKLLTHLGIPNEKVLVAGDTLNDYSMLSMGLPAVAVGNSEPALVEKLSGQEHVLHAQGAGVNGIAEAILHFEFLATRKEAA